MASRELEKELEKRMKVDTTRPAKTDEPLKHKTGGRKKVEREDGDGRFQYLLAVSPAIIYTTQASGDFGCTFVSENLRGIMGYTPTEMTNDPKHWPGHLHPDDAATVFAEFGRLIGLGGGSVEYRFRHRQGHYMWIQDTFRVMRDESGVPVEIVGSWADITQRKQAEQAALEAKEQLRRAHDELEKRVEARTAELEAGRERLRYVLAVSPAIIYTTQASGDYACTFVSESSREIMGYTPQETLAEENFWTSHLHPQDSKRVLSDVFRLVSQGGGNVEYRFRHRDGHYRWFQDTFKVFHDEAGQPLEIVGSWADVTHRKLAEATQALYEASLQSQEPLSLKKIDGLLQTGREVLHLDRLTIFRADAEGKFLQAMAATTTDEPLEAIRVPIGPEGGGLAQAYLTQKAITWDGHDTVPEEFRLKPPYDRIKALRSRVFAIMPMVVQGQAIGVLGADRKDNRGHFEPSMLEALRALASQAALAIEHSRLYAAAQPVLRRSLQLSEVYPAFARAVKALLPYDRIGVVVPGKDGLVMALSVAEPPLASWQGQTWTDTEGTAVDWVLAHKQPRLARDLSKDHAFPDDVFVAKEGVRSTLMLPLLAGGKTVGAFFLDSLTPDAYTERDLDLVDPVAQQLALAIENTRLFQEIEEKGRQLEVANRHKSQFVANMSHELRTPLNAILGYTELILDNIYGEVPEKMREVMNRLEKNGRHLLGLINDVLDLSKIEAGPPELSLADYSMKEVVQSAATAVEPLARERRLALKISVPPNLPRARGDERRITQVLLNLVGNAIKFTEAGEVRVEVTAADGNFLVSVSDTGPGISKDDQQRIFEEFQQAEGSSTRKKGGTGLGLFIAKRMIELHGGRIWVESSPGQGSTFWFMLPFRVEHQMEAK